MFWCIEKTTSHERSTIRNAISPIFVDLERAEIMIDTVIEEHFHDREQKPLGALDAEWVRTMLYVVRGLISDTITAYKLTVADTEDPRAKNYIAAAEAVKTAMQCEQACEGAYALENKLPAERRKPITDALAKIGDMGDAAAIMDNHQNSTDPLREEFETAISELTPDERAELLKMIRPRKAEKEQKYATETSRSIGRG